MRMIVIVGIISSSLLIGTGSAVAADPDAEGAEQTEGRQEVDHCDVSGGVTSGGGGLSVSGDCEGSNGNGAPQETSGASDAPEPPDPEDLAFEAVWSTQPESGEACIDWEVHEFEDAASSQQAASWQQMAMRMTGDQRLEGVEDAFCEGAQRDDPVGEALRFVRSIPLPEPDPSVPPGRLLTGLEGYLLIDGQQTFEESTDIDGFGTLSVELAPVEHRIDWGDGSELTVTTETGVAYPGGEGEITHVYTEVGQPVIQVTSSWQADWSVGGFSGTVTGLEVTDELPFEVEQVQAVRTR